MIGIGMPMAQARMPFMAVLLWLQEGNAGRGGVVPFGGMSRAGTFCGVRDFKGLGVSR
jgi:hypothetical protein